jgi:rSAM/selenodomain-associated transferase 2
MRISVVIPALDEADRISSLIEALHADGFKEVIVADGASSDATKAIASAAGALVVDAPRGRGKQLQCGAAAATGDHLFFIHADSVPPPDARRLIMQTLTKKRVVAGCFRLKFDDRHPVLTVFATVSRINHPLFTYGDQGLFLSRAMYDRVGGYSDAPVFEDVEILNRLRREGKFIKRSEPITTSARRFLRDGVVRREVTSFGLVLLYNMGVSPERIAHWYRAEKSFRE